MCCWRHRSSSRSKCRPAASIFGSLLVHAWALSTQARYTAHCCTAIKHTGTLRDAVFGKTDAKSLGVSQL